MAIPTDTNPYDYCSCCQNSFSDCVSAGIDPTICQTCEGVGMPRWRFFAEQIQCCIDNKEGGLVLVFRVGAQANCNLIPPGGVEESEGTANNASNWFPVLAIGDASVYNTQHLSRPCGPNPRIIAATQEHSNVVAPADIPLQHITSTVVQWVSEPFESLGVHNVDSQNIQYTGIVHPVAPDTKQTGIGYYIIKVEISQAYLLSSNFVWGNVFKFDWNVNCRQYMSCKDPDIDLNRTEVNSCGDILSMPYPFATGSSVTVSGGTPVDFLGDISFPSFTCCSIGLVTQSECIPGYNMNVGFPIEDAISEIVMGTGKGNTCVDNSWCSGTVVQNYRKIKHDYVGGTQALVVYSDDLTQKFDTEYTSGTKLLELDTNQLVQNVPYTVIYKVRNTSDYDWGPGVAGGNTNSLGLNLIHDNSTPVPASFEITGIKAWNYVGGVLVPVTITTNILSVGWVIPSGQSAEIAILATAHQDFKGTLQIVPKYFSTAQCGPVSLRGGFYSEEIWLDPSGPALGMCSETHPWERENDSNCCNIGVNLSFIASVPVVCDCTEVELTTSPSYFQFPNINIGSSVMQTISFGCVTQNCDGYYFDASPATIDQYCDQTTPLQSWYLLDSTGTQLIDTTLVGVDVTVPTPGTLDCNLSKEWTVRFAPSGVVDLVDCILVINYTLKQYVNQGDPICCSQQFVFNANSVCEFDCAIPHVGLPVWYEVDRKGAYVNELVLTPWDTGDPAEDNYLTNTCVCKLDDLLLPSQLPSNAVFQAYRQLTFNNPSSEDITIEINRTNNCLGADAFWIDFGPTVVLPNPSGVDAPFVVNGVTVHTYGTIKLIPGSTLKVNLYFNSIQLFNADIDAPCGPSSTSDPSLCDEIICEFDARLHKLCPIVQGAAIVDTWEEQCQHTFTPLLGLECCDCPPNCPCEDGENATSVELENTIPEEDPLWGDLFGNFSCCPEPIGNYCFVDKTDHLAFNLIEQAEGNAKFNWNGTEYNIVNDLFYLYLLLGLLDWERHLEIESIINAGVFAGTDPCDWELPTTLPILDAAGLNCMSEDEKKSCVCNHFQCNNIDIGPLLECKGLFTNLSLSPSQYELLGITPPDSGINYMCIEECLPSEEICPATQFIFKVK